MKQQPEENARRPGQTRPEEASKCGPSWTLWLLLSSIIATLSRGLDHDQVLPAALFGLIRASASAAFVVVAGLPVPTVSVAEANASGFSPSGRVFRTKYGNLREFILPPEIMSQQSSGRMDPLLYRGTSVRSL